MPAPEPSWINRRDVLAGLGALAVLPIAAPARADTAVDALSFGLDPAGLKDQSAALQKAILAAQQAGLPLVLPGGTYLVHDIDIPSGIAIHGVPGRTILGSWGEATVARLAGATDVTLDGLGFTQGSGGPRGEQSGLLEIAGSSKVSLSRCGFAGSPSNGLSLSTSSASITDCDFSGHALAALFSIDSKGLIVTNNTVADCGNGGILIWRSASGRDGSIVLGNVISRIGWTGGGNGQNGNGINVFRADQVIVSDNHISACAFTAVRLNSTNNTQVRGNTCIDSGEVAIFSEFAFSGSVIADNIVDGAAGGISITNFDQNGRLATCSGNIVRNIAPSSAVNPDTTPFGISAEADTSISGNVVEAVPGVGISAGWGPFLRDVGVTNNVVRDCGVGIGVSVADGAGVAVVNGNLVSGASRAGIAALAWTEIRSDDLVRDTATYPNVRLNGNSVS